MSIRTLRTTDEVIDFLGGTSVVARTTGRGASTVSMWRSAGKFPNDLGLYLKLTGELTQRNHSAPLALWGIPGAARRNGSPISRPAQQPRRRKNGRRA